MEIDFYSIKLGDGNTNGNSVAPCKIAVYCGKTGREINHQGNERRYQIVNTQDDYQVHSACIYFSQDELQNGSVGQEIQLKICTNSYLTALREQKISIQLAKFEVTPIVKRNLWLRLRKKKRVELKIENSGTYPLRIFSIPTDLDKIEVEYPETDNGKTEVSCPMVIQTDKPKNLGVTIKSSFKEWLWSGTDLSKISVPIYANTIRDSEDSCVFADEDKIERAPIFEIAEVTLVLIFIIALFMYSLFFPHPKREVIVSSYPHGQTVSVDGEEAGTTPTLLKVKGNARIQIGSSNEMQVKDVQKEGTIFFSGSGWKTGKGKSK